MVPKPDKTWCMVALDLWPTTLTYISNLAKIKVDLHAEIEGHMSNVSAGRAIMDRWTLPSAPSPCSMLCKDPKRPAMLQVTYQPCLFLNRRSHSVSTFTHPSPHLFNGYGNRLWYGSLFVSPSPCSMLCKDPKRPAIFQLIYQPCLFLNCRSHSVSIFYPPLSTPVKWVW